MSSEARHLDAAQVRGLFIELSDRLDARGVQAQLFVVGGAAMALAYDQGRLTRDVDALFVPAPAVRVAAAEIGAVHGLEPDWLNDAAKGFLPGPDEHPQTVFESESLLVQVASPEYLLAMKLFASRDERDLIDAATLFSRLGYTTAQEAVDLLSSTYPPLQLLPRHFYIAEDVAHRAAQRAVPSTDVTDDRALPSIRADEPADLSDALDSREQCPPPAVPPTSRVPPSMGLRAAATLDRKPPPPDLR